MVSVYANPPPGQDFYGYYPMVMRTGLPGLDSLNPSAANGQFTTGSVNSGMEDPNKKVRKPYTVTKSRESWTELEHDKFLEALQLFDRDWKKIEAFVGSKTVIQIRSHAQKYFLKVQKSGANEHLPPPRPKRKASHPYPQKAPKKAVSQGTVPFQSSVALAEPGHVIWSDSFSVPESSINPSWSAWTYDNVPAVSMAHVKKENMVLAGASATMTQNRSSSSNEIAPSIWPNSEAKDQGKERQDKPMRATPDFAQVYSFIGSVFDANASDHLQRLRKMDPINVETVLMLIKNLSANLISPEFEDHRRLLSSQSAGTDKDKTDASSKNIQAMKSGIAVPSV